MNNDTTTTYFWHEYDHPYAFLCQWYLSDFQDTAVHPTHKFNCTEQYMMYRKARTFATTDPGPLPPSKYAKKSIRLPIAQKVNIKGIEYEVSELPDLILAEAKPKRQKALARSIPATKPQLDEWERVKFDIVVQGSYCKYSQNPELHKSLLVTGNRHLAEASPMDRVWRIGFEEEHAEMNKKEWGSNLLGEALMQVRERLEVQMVGDALDEATSTMGLLKAEMVEDFLNEATALMRRLKAEDKRVE